jgi:NitT/TauT family transport system substrate-binding protein
MHLDGFFTRVNLPDCRDRANNGGYDVLKQLLAAAAITCVMNFAGMAEAGTLKIGHSTWVGYGPFYIAQAKGYFKEEGVDVEFTIMEDTAIKIGAMFAGQIDIAASTSDEFPSYLQPGKSARYFMAVDYSNGGDGIVATKDISSVAGLKGKKIAFEQGTISQFFLNVVLKKNGLTQADIEAVNMTAADSGTAFVAGQVDAAVTWEPALSMGATSPNGHLLASSAELPGVIVDVLATTGETAKAKDADLRAFARAWYRALDFLKSNPDESYAIMAKGVGGWIEKPADFKAAAGGIQYLDKAANGVLFGTPGSDGALHKTVADAIEIWKGFQKIQVEVAPKDLIEQSVYGG